MKASPNHLRQARENVGLSVKQMAYLIGTDVSNLSKQERGTRKVSKEIMLGYTIITGVPMQKLITLRFQGMVQYISGRAFSLINQLESFARSDKKARNAIAVIERVISNIACLQDVSESENEE